MKQRNVAIEIWRFLISVAIIGFHVGWIIAMSCNGSLGYWMERSNWFFGSSEVLLIFTGTRAAQTAWSTFGAQLASTNGMGGSADGATGTLGFNNGFLFVMLGMKIGRAHV